MIIFDLHFIRQNMKQYWLSRPLAKAEETVSIAGKCCESGDMLIWDLPLPKAEENELSSSVLHRGIWVFNGQ